MPIQITDPALSTASSSPPVAVGIDFGTTHCVVALASKGQAKTIFLEGEEGLVPSVVSYGDGEPKVGKAAIAQIPHNAEYVIPSVKRVLEGDLVGSDVYSVHKLLEKTEGGLRFKIRDKKISPVQVARDIFLYLKEKTEQKLGIRDLSQAVITVPAYFSEQARNQVRLAADMAGIRVLRLLSEPTAAALAYGLENKKEGYFLVYDLGGGTFDVSVLHLTAGFFQVLATGGDAALGGDDIDALIVHDIMRSAHEKKLEITGDPSVLYARARSIKESLGGTQKATMKIPVAKGAFSYTLTRSQLNHFIYPLIKKTMRILETTLKEAGVSTEHLNDIILVGGSTRLTLVHEMITQFFGRSPLCKINPDEVVAWGAALQASALLHGSDTLLQDITPLSLGIETMGGIVEVLIPRNSPIPNSVAQEFTTYEDNQTALSIHVVQGERELVRDCRSLGKFVLTNLPALPAGVARIEIRFTLDADGLLVVSAMEKTTGTIQSLEIKPAHGLNAEEIKSMLHDSMIHARGDMKERLKKGEIVILKRMKALLDMILKSPAATLPPSQKKSLEEYAARIGQDLEHESHEALLDLRQDIEKAMKGLPIVAEKGED